MKNAVRFAHGLFNFTYFHFSVVSFAMKLKDANDKSHQNIIVFCDQ